MKNKIILIFSIFMILSVGFVNALDFSVENYYPAPVEAGEYFNIWLRIINNEDSIMEKSAIRFKQTYPFSLDPGEEREIIIDKINEKSSVTKKFKIRVDKEAKEGDNILKFEYKDCAGCIWEEKGIPITVIEFQTMFDMVLQEVSSEGVYIAIANIGKNPANAITVSIPEQEYFRTDLISASIVGNLDSGDYTIAAFKILPKQRDIREKQDLLVQLEYTDPFGVRRTIVESIQLNPSSLSGLSMSGTETTETEMMVGRGIRKTSSFSINNWFWVSLILVLILLRKQIKGIYKKFRKPKQKP